MPRDSAAADRPASYLVGTAAAFPLFFRDRTKPINQLPFSPSAKFPKSGSSCESRANLVSECPRPDPSVRIAKRWPKMVDIENILASLYAHEINVSLAWGSYGEK